MIPQMQKMMVAKELMFNVILLITISVFSRLLFPIKPALADDSKRRIKTAINPPEALLYSEKIYFSSGTGFGTIGGGGG